MKITYNRVAVVILRFTHTQTMAGQRILVLGSGPTGVGQGAEYMGAVAAACRTLRFLGHHVILLESQTCALASAPEGAHTVYFEPLNRESIEKVLRAERPHSLLATVGGRAGLHTMLLLQRLYSNSPRCAALGTSFEVLETALHPEHVVRAGMALGIRVPQVFIVNKKKQAEELGRQLGFPVVVRPMWAAGSLGTAITYNTQELDRAIDVALAVSPAGQAVIEKSLAGQQRTAWVVARDMRGATRVIGGVEYLEPLGIYSGDSPAVTPVQSFSVADSVAVQEVVQHVVERLRLTGVSTVHLAHGVTPREVVLLSVSPYMTSVALWCGRAQAVPVVEWHVSLNAGVPLGELERAAPCDDLFGEESRAKRVWCRWPVFPGRRLMGVREQLTTYAKSVGSVTGVGENFLSALQRALRAAALPVLGPGFVVPKWAVGWTEEDVRAEVSVATPLRLWHIYHALHLGFSIEELAQLTRWAPWVLEQVTRLHDLERRWSEVQPRAFVTTQGESNELLREALAMGCSESQLADALGMDTERFRERCARRGFHRVPVVVTDDGQGGTQHLILESYGGARPRPAEGEGNVIVLGANASLLQGSLEYEYLAARVIAAVNAAGHKCILISPTPLHAAAALGLPVRHYLEPAHAALTEIVAAEQPAGVILQCSERVPTEVLQQVRALELPVWGTSAHSLERLATRDRFHMLLQKLDIRQPSHSLAHSAQQAYTLAEDVGYPVIVHPAHPHDLPRVTIWYDRQDARHFFEQATHLGEVYPLSIEKFLEEAREFHVDALADGEEGVVVGIHEHVEEAGIHSADSAAVWPAHSLADELVRELRLVVQKLVQELRLCGFFGVKCALAQDKLYVLDVLPHAARSVALLDLVYGGRLVPAGVHALLGGQLREKGVHELVGDFLAVRAPVFPFRHFPASDTALGPEHCAVGQALGIDRSFGIAYAKALTAAGNRLPSKGKALLSVADRDKPEIIAVAKKLRALGFNLLATAGTAALLRANGIPAEHVLKVHEGRPNVIDHIIDGEVQLIINTPGGKANRIAEAHLRHEAVDRGILVLTTLAGARAAVTGIEAFMRHGFDVTPHACYLQTLRQQPELTLDTQPTMEL
ncbi:MAG: carbamoyl-phosphate synthase large subunit [bacterium]|nr:carbamoyl-phosphate synthase large subunit [bacterium]